MDAQIAWFDIARQPITLDPTDFGDVLRIARVGAVAREALTAFLEIERRHGEEIRAGVSGDRRTAILVQASSEFGGITLRHRFHKMDFATYLEGGHLTALWRVAAFDHQAEIRISTKNPEDG